ncbi:MAG: hypothetical protein GWN16_07420 [Calditrichae bacterium]|nr:hypothetical protein [Calditrichia bacterium]
MDRDGGALLSLLMEREENNLILLSSTLVDKGSIYQLTLLPYFEKADADLHREKLNPASFFYSQ